MLQNCVPYNFDLQIHTSTAPSMDKAVDPFG